MTLRSDAPSRGSQRRAERLRQSALTNYHVALSLRSDPPIFAANLGSPQHAGARSNHCLGVHDADSCAGVTSCGCYSYLRSATPSWPVRVEPSLRGLANNSMIINDDAFDQVPTRYWAPADGRARTPARNLNLAVLRGGHPARTRKRYGLLWPLSPARRNTAAASRYDSAVARRRRCVTRRMRQAVEALRRR